MSVSGDSTGTTPPGGTESRRGGLRRLLAAHALARTLTGERGRPDRRAPDGSSDAAGEAGMATAEYAVGTLAAAAFAGLLLTVVKSGSVQGILESLISAALSVG